jgi:hypothetical protein
MCPLVGEMRGVPGIMVLREGEVVGGQEQPHLVAGLHLLLGMRESTETVMMRGREVTEETDMIGATVEEGEVTTMRGETDTAVTDMTEDITMTTEVMEEVEEVTDITDRTAIAGTTGRMRGAITDLRAARKKRERRRSHHYLSLTGVQRSLLPLTGGSQGRE